MDRDSSACSGSRVVAHIEQPPCYRKGPGGKEGTWATSRLELLDRGEQPFPILVAHESPDFAGLSRGLLITLDQIARLSSLFRQGYGIVTGTPVKPYGCVSYRVFGPCFPYFCTEKHHIFHMICHV